MYLYLKDVSSQQVPIIAKVLFIPKLHPQLRMMLKTLLSFAHNVDYVSAIRTPYNNDGAQRSEGRLTSTITDLHELINSSAFSPDDLVSRYPALPC
jgi:hypothetical protein